MIFIMNFKIHFQNKMYDQYLPKKQKLQECLRTYINTIQCILKLNTND